MPWVANATESWVAYAIEALGFRGAAFLGLVLAGIAIALIAGAVAALIARLDQKRRQEATLVTAVLAIVLTPMLYDAVPWPTIRVFLPYLFFVAIAVLFNDLRHVGQWLALGVGMLMLAGNFSVLIPVSGQLPFIPETGAAWGFAGMFTLFFGPKLIGELMKPEPGGESFWRLSRWSAYDLFLLLFFLILSALAAGQMSGPSQWLVTAVIGLPAALLAIYVVLKDRLWHPRKWWRPRSAYQAGLLAVAGSLVIIGLVGETGQMVCVLLFLAGVVATLFGNLRHPAQWLAAGAGFALAAGAFALPELREPPIAFLVGVLTILFAPRLIGLYLERQTAPGA